MFECSALSCIIRQLKYPCDGYRGDPPLGCPQLFVIGILCCVHMGFLKLTLEIVLTRFWTITERLG